MFYQSPIQVRCVLKKRNSTKRISIGYHLNAIDSSSLPQKSAGPILPGKFFEEGRKNIEECPTPTDGFQGGDEI